MDVGYQAEPHNLCFYSLYSLYSLHPITLSLLVILTRYHNIDSYIKILEY